MTDQPERNQPMTKETAALLRPGDLLLHSPDRGAALVVTFVEGVGGLGSDLAIVKREGEDYGANLRKLTFISRPATQSVVVPVEPLTEMRAAAGYLRNAKIDLETGAPKATAIRTIEGGLKRLEGAIDAFADDGKAIKAAPAPSSLAGGEDMDALDQELIDRGLRTVRAYDAVRFLRDALSATTTRLTGYDWNSDPDGLTKQQGDAFALADKVFADQSAAVDAHPDTELPECQSCGGTGKIEEAARTEGANQHSACVRTCDDCDGCGFAPDEESSAILAALSPEAPSLENPDEPCAPENARDWPTIPARPVHIVRVSGATLDEQKAAVRQSETYQRGDTVLCWVNEGDLYVNPSVVFEDLSALTTRETADRETLVMQSIIDAHGQWEIENRNRKQGDGQLWQDGHVRLLAQAAIIATDHIGEANEKVTDHIGDATTMIDHAELARLAEAAGGEALGNLLAVIHGDGGHRALEVGTKQAALEAEKIVAGLFAAPSADKLREVLRDLMDMEFAKDWRTWSEDRATRLLGIGPRLNAFLAAREAALKAEGE